MQYNDFYVHFSMFSCIFPELKIFRRYPQIFRDLERSLKVKDLFEDLCKVFQRYFKDNVFTEMNKLKTFKNLFKIFMTFCENLGSLKIKRLQRFS